MISDLIEDETDEKHFIVKGKRYQKFLGVMVNSILELGAGAGLPSMISSLNGAQKVILHEELTNFEGCGH